VHPLASFPAQPGEIALSLHAFPALIGDSIFALTPGNPFWPYFTGIAILTIGLITYREDLFRARSLEKLLVLAPLFFVAPMAAFASQHFTDAESVSTIVPAWMPWHMFWTYFVGAALIAAALSIAMRKLVQLAAILLAVMLLSFVLLLHTHNIAVHPKSLLMWATAFRDIAFSGGALALAALQTPKGSGRSTPALKTIARILVSVPLIVFGVAHFFRPEALPACDFDQRTPAWMPLHIHLGYLAGIVFIPLGLALLANFKTRTAAISLGITVLVLLLLVYLPLVAAKPSDIANGLDYFVSTLAFSGTFLLLAAATPRL
jgi:uncharacterized membrane protein